MDNINYKIFQCFDLLSEFDNLVHNYAFYVIAGVFLVLLFIDLMFFIYTIPNIRKSMLKETPTPEKVKEETRKELIRLKRLSLINQPPKKLKNKSSKRVNKSILNRDTRNNTTSKREIIKKITRKISKKLTEKISKKNIAKKDGKIKKSINNIKGHKIKKMEVLNLKTQQ